MLISNSKMNRCFVYLKHRYCNKIFKWKMNLANPHKNISIDYSTPKPKMVITIFSKFINYDCV